MPEGDQVSLKWDPLRELSEKLEEFKTTECKNSTEECFKVPMKQCNNITEQVCNGTVEQCTQTELNGADCGGQTVCSWERQVKCPAPKKSKGPPADEEAIAMVMSMGFTREQAEMGLRNTENNMERAVDWIFR